MKLKITLATATALGLLMGAAQAGSNNQTELLQDGASHSASVNQADGDNNSAGSAAQALTQKGKRNQLTITQSGDGNQVGLETNGDNVAPGVNGVSQASLGSRAADTNTPNRLTISQTSNGNVVGAVSQVYHGDVPGGSTTATITQEGTGGHRIGTLTQRRVSTASNAATITQAGSSNTIERIYQRSTQGGSGTNQLIVSMFGADNGEGAWTAGGAAQGSGALASNLIQGDGATRARANYANLSVFGTGNQFGISQYEQSNTVGSVTITGSSNQLGVYQDGTSNTLQLADIGGNFNEIGLRQMGDYNLAGVTIDGSFNGTGATAWSGPAGDVAGGRPSGLIEQLSPGGTTLALQNSVSLTIETDDNEFSLFQDGQDNSIVGLVDTGSHNLSAVAQVGSGNTASYTQSGDGNNVGISQ